VATHFCDLFSSQNAGLRGKMVKMGEKQAKSHKNFVKTGKNVGIFCTFSPRLKLKCSKYIR